MADGVELIDGDRSIRIFTCLDQAEPDEYDPLCGFWDVKLDGCSLAPIAYNGVVPDVPHDRLGSAETS